MIRIVAPAAIAGCIVVAAASPAAANQAADRNYETIWIIESDQSQLGTRVIAKDQPILEQTLLPFGLAVAEENITSEAGKVLVEKGDQLFQLKVATGQSFCVVNVPRPSLYRSFMLGGGNLQLCLTDTNADGVFDGHFNGGNPMKGVPFIEGRIPKNPKKASGRYSLLDPKQFALRYTVRITLDRATVQSSGTALSAYKIDFGDDQTRQSLTASTNGRIGANSILGSIWNVTEIEDNRVNVDVLRAMPSQPFQVARNVTYR